MRQDEINTHKEITCVQYKNSGDDNHENKFILEIDYFHKSN